MKIYTNDINQIQIYCLQIRQVIDKIKANTFLLKDFPLGCCRDTSIITGMLLKEKGIKHIYYCCKDIDAEFASHAWLEYKKILIDLTANQFHSCFEEVIVIPIQAASKLHRKRKRELCNFSIAGMDLPNLLSDYKMIKFEIEKSGYC